MVFRFHLVWSCGLALLVAGQARAGENLSQAIDRMISAGWSRANVKPAARADDTEFVRRAYLDVVGRIPCKDEVLAFLADTAPSKRARLIDALIQSGEFPKHWRENLNMLLMGGPAFAGDPQWRQWLETSLAENKKWDEMARAIMSARADKPKELPASQFLLSRFAQGDSGLDTATRDVSRFFFGVDIQCARCHRHPDVNQWKQESYWGMAAFYGRSYPLVVKGKTYLAEKATGDVEYTTKQKTKKTATPTFLTGEKLSEPRPIPSKAVAVAASKTKAAVAAAANVSAENLANYFVPPEESKEKTRVPVPWFSRRSRFVESAIRPANPFFKKALVNYVWSQLMGRGLVEPVDQMHDGNPASHPELLNFLGDDFAAHQFDLRYLIRTILNSETYQLSSRYPAGQPRPAEATYACAAIRPLSMHQLATSLLVAAGYYEALKPNPDADSGTLRARLEAQHAGLLASLVKNLSGGTGSYQPGVAEALFQTNSRTFADVLEKGGLASRVAGSKDVAAVIQDLFLCVLSRPANSEELGRMLSYLRERSDRRAGAELLWALVTSSEFRFNH